MYYAVTFVYTLPATPTQTVRLQRTLPVKAYTETSAIEKAEAYIRSTIVKLYGSDFTITEVKEVPDWEAFQKVIENSHSIKKLELI